MDFDLTRAIAKSATRLVVDLPFGMLLIRLWVWGGVFELIEMPRPNWKQTFAVVILILTIAPST